MDTQFYSKRIIDLERQGYIIIKDEFDKQGSKQVLCYLSNLGRSKIKVVFVGGVFDILHPGHIYTLKAAKSYGDILVVIVATTSTALKTQEKQKYLS